MAEQGFLAIWSDIDREAETDYLHWLTREHTAERVGVPGFLGVRVFRALQEEVSRYFILYALSSRQVLGSGGYLQRLNAPTPWSTRIMPQLGNFRRGGGHVAMETGQGRGGVLAAIPFAAASEVDAVRCEVLGRADRITTVRLLDVDSEGSGIMTAERRMRGGDASFARLLLVEGVDVSAVAATVAPFVPDNGTAPLYRQVFSLDKAELST